MCWRGPTPRVGWKLTRNIGAAVARDSEREELVVEVAGNNDATKGMGFAKSGTVAGLLKDSLYQKHSCNKKIDLSALKPNLGHLQRVRGRAGVMGGRDLKLLNSSLRSNKTG